jgi:hypothetical protein
MSRRSCFVVLAALLAVGVPAGRAHVEPPAPLVAEPEPAILTIERSGGLRVAGAVLAPLPEAVLYADGTLITLGRQLAVYPPPALANVRRRHLTPKAVAAARALAESSALGKRSPGYGRPPVVDAPTTRFTYRARTGRTFVHRVYALGVSIGVPPATGSARQRLRVVVERLATPERAFGSANVGPNTRYSSASYEIVSRVAAAAPRPGSEAARAWPVASVRLDEAATCTPVTGPDARALHAALAGATTLTRWRDGGGLYTVANRPVLPGETPCR